MIRVVVVEDEPLAAEAHVAYVGRVPGFTAVATAYTGQEALRILRNAEADLVLLDMRLPDMHGLDVCRTLRARGTAVDVLAVTSARDLSVVRSAVSLGIVGYLLKPFVFSAMREKLERYAEYRHDAEAAGAVAGQHEVDRLLGALRAPAATGLPKGMSPESLDAVAATLRATDGGLSAAEVAAAVGSSRVTARRYLEHLADVGTVARRPRYGTAGRPELEYQWRR